jgi:hypothetical protein
MYCMHGSIVVLTRRVHLYIASRRTEQHKISYLVFHHECMKNIVSTVLTQCFQFRKNPEKRERKQRERQEAEQKKQDEEQLKREIQQSRLESEGLVPPRFDPVAARTPFPFKNDDKVAPVDMKRLRSMTSFDTKRLGSIGNYNKPQYKKPKPEPEDPEADMKRLRAFENSKKPQYETEPEDPDVITPLPPLESRLTTKPLSAMPPRPVAPYPQFKPEPEDPGAITPLPLLASSLPTKPSSAMPSSPMTPSPPIHDTPSPVSPPTPKPDSPVEKSQTLWDRLLPTKASNAMLSSPATACPPTQETPSSLVSPPADSPAEKTQTLWGRLSSTVIRKQSLTDTNGRGGIKSTWVYTLPRSWRHRHQIPSPGSKAEGKLPATNVDDPFLDNGVDYSSDTGNPFASIEDDRHGKQRRIGLPEHWHAGDEVNGAGPSHTFSAKPVKEERERYSKYITQDDGYWNDPDDPVRPVLEQWALQHKALVEEYDPDEREFARTSVKLPEGFQYN